MNKIEKAIIFATKAHAGTCRKGKDKPYILHPIETMETVMRFTEDEDVLAAAVLHDTVEDTAVTAERLEKEFGPRVAALVASVSEDKKRDRSSESTWKERKQETISQLRNASYETKLICLGDKLSNLREMENDYADIDDALWERFNQKDKAMHAWYYRSIYEILKQDFGDSWELYEFEGILDFVFAHIGKEIALPESWYSDEGGAV